MSINLFFNKKMYRYNCKVSIIYICISKLERIKGIVYVYI